MPALAAAAGRSIGHVWLRLPRLPLGYSDATLSEIERADATNALNKGGAVWDPGSICIAGGLGESLVDVVRNALPASSVSQATLDEASEVLRKVGSDSGMELAHDPETGGLVPIDIPESDVQREQARAEGRWNSLGPSWLGLTGCPKRTTT